MAKFNETARALLEALDDPALVVDGHVVRLANGPARALLGQAIEGRDLRIAIRHPQALEFALAGKPGNIELTGIGELGRPWRVSVRPLAGNAILVHLVDRSAAHAADKLRVDFVANASHELRTPLTAVLGYAESLEDGDVDRELASKFATTIRGEAKRMLRIIEDLMSLSRIEADRFVAPGDMVSVGSILRSAVDTTRSAAEECGCEVQLDVEENLPRIPGDFPQIVQVVDNLLSNALRYGCPVPRCRIRASARVEGGFIRLEVSDSGPGIPREHLPFITRRFYRVDAARSRGTGGTGLGLAIVKHIVERHRGTLAIDSEVGRGTTVTVRLPIHA